MIGGEGEDAAPADELRQEPGEGRAGELADDDGHEIAAERHLPLGHLDPVADQRNGERHRSAGRGAGDDAQGEQRRDVRREEGAGQRQEEQRQRRPS